MSELTPIVDVFESSQNRLAFVGHKVEILDTETDSPVINIQGRRGIGLNFPPMSVVTGFSIYVSPNDIAKGQPNSLMALLDGQTFVPDDTVRTAFSSSFVAEHFFAQIIADADETSDYEYYETRT